MGSLDQPQCTRERQQLPTRECGEKYASDSRIWHEQSSACDRAKNQSRGFALENLATVLSTAELEKLRAGYDKRGFLEANQHAFSDAYPPLGPWTSAAATLLYGDDPLSPKQRELCLITLLAYRAPGLALATHVYWGVMEGLTVEQVCHAVSLAGCYGGFPTLAEAFVVLKRTLAVLHGLVAGSSCDSKTVLTAIVREFGKTAL